MAAKDMEIQNLQVMTIWPFHRKPATGNTCLAFSTWLPNAAMPSQPFRIRSL